MFKLDVLQESLPDIIYFAFDLQPNTFFLVTWKAAA